MKKIILLVMVILSVFVFFCSVSAADNISIKVNSKSITFDAKPYIDNSRTMIPIRFIAENLGANVEWNQKLRVVTIKKGNTNIELKIGNNKAIVNGKVVLFDAQSSIRLSRTFVPLRFVSEALGADVYWDAEKKTVFISTEKFVEPKVKVDYPGISSSIYMDLILDNYSEYNSDYQFKIYFTNYPLNVIEYQNPVTEKWEKVNMVNYFAPSTQLYSLPVKNYTTRNQYFEIKNNMVLKYIITVCNKKTGITKEYQKEAIVLIKP